MSEISTLFAEWRVYREWCDRDREEDDAEHDRRSAARIAMEDRILALPSTDARDVLMKIMIASLEGDVPLGGNCDGFSGPIFAEARAMVAESPGVAA